MTTVVPTTWDYVRTGLHGIYPELTALPDLIARHAQTFPTAWQADALQWYRDHGIDTAGATLEDAMREYWSDPALGESGIMRATVVLTGPEVYDLESGVTLVDSLGEGNTIVPLTLAIVARGNGADDLADNTFMVGGILTLEDGAGNSRWNMEGGDLGFGAVAVDSFAQANEGYAGAGGLANISGYENLPIVLVSADPVQLVGPATAITIRAAGTGYAVNDTLTMNDADLGTGVVLTVATINGGGGVTGVTITNPGLALLNQATEHSTDWTTNGGGTNFDAVVTAIDDDDNPATFTAVLTYLVVPA